MSAPGPQPPELARRARAQAVEARELATDLDEPAFQWRPRPEKWSVGEHLAHVPLTNRPYYGPIRRALDEARAKGAGAKGPFDGGPLGRWFVGFMEPPPRRRVPTMKRLKPPPRLDRARVAEEFEEAQRELADLLGAAEGVDLEKTRIRSPFMPLMRFSLMHAFQIIDAHTRRHLWLARRVTEAPGFPGNPGPGGGRAGAAPGGRADA